MDEISDNKIIDFRIMRINRNAQKICRCNPPSYEIDTKNRLIQCTKCNAYIQAFDALLYMAENMEEYDSKIDKIHEEIKKITEKRNKYAREVNELSRKKFRMNKFRDIQNSYMRGMVPVCPHCEKAFDPTEIDGFTNKDYCDYKKKVEEE